MGGLVYKSISTDNRVDGKTIVITGANTGIGLETAAELFRRGSSYFSNTNNYSMAFNFRIAHLKTGLVISNIKIKNNTNYFH